MDKFFINILFIFKFYKRIYPASAATIFHKFFNSYDFLVCCFNNYIRQYYKLANHKQFQREDQNKEPKGSLSIFLDQVRKIVHLSLDKRNFLPLETEANMRTKLAICT